MTSVFVALLAQDDSDLDDAIEDVARLSAPGVELDWGLFAGPAVGRAGARCWSAGSAVGIGVLRSVAVATAQTAGFDQVLLVHPGGRLPENLVRTLVAVVSADQTIAVASPWRTQLGEVGLAPGAAVPELDRGAVDRMSRALRASFGLSARDAPLATERCALLSLRYLDRLGPLDVALDEGGVCEWALRARAAGLRAVLAPGCLVGARAEGSTIELLLGADRAIVTSRYPLLATQLDAVVSSGFIAALRRSAVVALAEAGAARSGWELVEGDATRPEGLPVLVVHEHGGATLCVDGLELALGGFAAERAADEGAELLGRRPRSESWLGMASLPS